MADSDDAEREPSQPGGVLESPAEAQDERDPDTDPFRAVDPGPHGTGPFAGPTTGSFVIPEPEPTGDTFDAGTCATIGRSRECDIVLGDSNVSRKHARIAVSPAGDWTIEDLGSTNGVQVNGARATGPAVLRPGDRLDLGTVSARFEVE